MEELTASLHEQEQLLKTERKHVSFQPIHILTLIFIFVRIIIFC